MSGSKTLAQVARRLSIAAEMIKVSFGIVFTVAAVVRGNVGIKSRAYTMNRRAFRAKISGESIGEEARNSETRAPPLIGANFGDHRRRVHMIVLDHDRSPSARTSAFRFLTQRGHIHFKISPWFPRVGTKSRDKPPRLQPSRRNYRAAGSAADAAPPAYDTGAAPPVKRPRRWHNRRPYQNRRRTKRSIAAEKPAPDQTTPEVKNAGVFVVQVAALNDADKARQMQEQIAAAGVKSYTEVVPTTKGSVTRVRAGPFASRDEAEKVRDKLKDLGLTGNIAPK